MSGTLQVDATAHTMAKYVMELSLLEYNLCHVRPSEIAAVALAFSLKALDTDEKTLSELWTPSLEYFSQYSVQDFSGTLQQVCDLMRF